MIRRRANTFAHGQDMAVLRYSGMMGHEFTGIFTDDEGERKKRCETNTFAEATAAMKDDKEATVYQRGKKCWYLVEEA